MDLIKWRFLRLWRGCIRSLIDTGVIQKLRDVSRRAHEMMKRGFDAALRVIVGRIIGVLRSEA